MQDKDSSWDRLATAEAKNAIFAWLLAGWAYNAYAGELLSISSFLLFIPGIFIASLAALPAALINTAKIRSVSAMRYRRRGVSFVAMIVFWSLWWLIDLAYPVVFAVLAMRLLHRWVG